jgi:hypothetical protein
MLADQGEARASSGALQSDLYLPETTKLALIDFIANELPKWRDRPDRPEVEAEDQLTGQLCRHMNEACRQPGWDHFQFGAEVPDEINKGRTIDLAAAPSSGTLCIGERRYSIFDVILPIECKRLPTPKGKNRDEREYVFSQHKSTGGIQRFKAGHHGSNHRLCAMIGYVQSKSIPCWSKSVADWISGLCADNALEWTATDELVIESHDTDRAVSSLKSTHARTNGLSDVELRHLWIEMQKSTVQQ